MKTPPKFSGENLITWALRFEQWMQWKDMWNVFISDPPAEDATDEVHGSWRRKNAQGFYALTLLVGDDELQAMKEFKDKKCSSKLAWNVLRTHVYESLISMYWKYATS